MYDFDEIVDRHGTGCVKFDAECVPAGTLPMWVADMDFKTPDFIVDALKERLEHPVLGYSLMPDDYFGVVASWVRSLHGWNILPSQIRYIPGIVKGIGMVINAFLRPGDKVIIQPPVYHPFRFVPQKSGCEVIYNPLVELPGGGYRMDFDQLESIIDANTRLLILSNPHNPAGICWDRKTLEALAEVTSRRGVMVISDEIHCEMLLPSCPGVESPKHVPYASVSDAAASNSITFMAPSKTFNIAGVVTSYAIVLNPMLREKFFNYLDAGELDSPNLFSTIATMAAYGKGAQWRREMLDYVRGNVDFVCGFLAERMPSGPDGRPLVRCLRPQASFLVWMDFRSLGLPQTGLVKLLESAGVYMNDGSIFGSIMPDGTPVGHEGDGFMRLNVGCPRSVVAEAMERIRAAVQSLF